MPRQESVVASLHELRAIEQQRIADELAAQAAERAAREATRVAQEARLAEEARAARDAVLAEAARAAEEAAAARRADALAIACAEAEARARASAALDAERMAQEMRVRHEQVARTRPLALLAVIAALVLGGGALAVVLVDQRADLAEREAAIRAVETRAEKLHEDSTDLAKVAHDLQLEVDARQAELAAQAARIRQLQAPVAASAPRAAPRAPTGAIPASPPPRPPVVIDASCAGSVLCTK